MAQMGNGVLVRFQHLRQLVIYGEPGVQPNGLPVLGTPAMKRLTSLTLDHMPNSSLPTVVASLTDLEELGVPGARPRLKNLMDVVPELTRLTRLDLSHTTLASLPSEMSALTRLRSLSLAGSGFGRGAAASVHVLSSLPSLTTLDLRMYSGAAIPLLPGVQVLR